MPTFKFNKPEFLKDASLSDSDKIVKLYGWLDRTFSGVENTVNEIDSENINEDFLNQLGGIKDNNG